MRINTSLPPPLPNQALVRVLRIAFIDGIGLVIIAGGFGLLAAFGGDWVGALVGSLAAVAGLAELLGRRKLLAGDFSGTRLLVGCQLLLLALILIYVTYQYFAYDPLPTIRKVEAEILAAQQKNGLEPISFAETLGLSESQFANILRRFVKITYISIGVASILLQGGLAYYYHRKSRAITSRLRKT